MFHITSQPFPVLPEQVIDARGQRSERTELLETSAKIVFKAKHSQDEIINCGVFPLGPLLYHSHTLVRVCLNVQNFEDIALE